MNNNRIFPLHITDNASTLLATTNHPVNHVHVVIVRNNLPLTKPLHQVNIQRLRQFLPPSSTSPNRQFPPPHPGIPPVNQFKGNTANNFPANAFHLQPHFTTMNDTIPRKIITPTETQDIRRISSSFISFFLSFKIQSLYQKKNKCQGNEGRQMKRCPSPKRNGHPHNKGNLLYSSSICLATSTGTIFSNFSIPQSSMSCFPSSSQ